MHHNVATGRTLKVLPRRTACNHNSTGVAHSYDRHMSYNVRQSSVASLMRASHIAFMLTTMGMLPWNRPSYRDRHGRGVRTPTFGTRLPHYRTNSARFDRLVKAQILRLRSLQPELLANVQFAVEDIPASDPAPWESNISLFSRSFNASHAIAARVVLYRLPLQSHNPNAVQLALAIRDELVIQVAQLFDQEPQDIDPDVGF